MTGRRDHYVYRLYDMSGELLYIGFTKNLEQRWQQHRTERPAVVLAAARCRVQGPYTRAKARAIESMAILSEGSLFNQDSFRALPRAEQLRRNVIAGFWLGIPSFQPAQLTYSCPARDILIAEGLMTAVAS